MLKRFYFNDGGYPLEMMFYPLVIRPYFYHPLILTIFQQEVVIENEEDAKHLYFRFLPGTVRFITAFAKEIPLFKTLTQDDQRILIKAGILETSAIYDSSHVEITDFSLVNSKLNLTIPKDNFYSIGHLGSVFVDIVDSINRLKKLELTDVELSLLAALVLFSPGKPF